MKLFSFWGEQTLQVLDFSYSILSTLQILWRPCLSQTKPFWSICTSWGRCNSILFADTLQRIFKSLFRREIVLYERHSFGGLPGSNNSVNHCSVQRGRQSPIFSMIPGASQLMMIKCYIFLSVLPPFILIMASDSSSNFRSSSRDVLGSKSETQNPKHPGMFFVSLQHSLNIQNYKELEFFCSTVCI